MKSTAHVFVCDFLPKRGMKTCKNTTIINGDKTEVGAALLAMKKGWTFNDQEGVGLLSYCPTHPHGESLSKGPNKQYGPGTIGLRHGPFIGGGLVVYSVDDNLDTIVLFTTSDPVDGPLPLPIEKYTVNMINEVLTEDGKSGT